MRFTLLGPVQVIADGEPLTGIAPRHRAVLAYLLINAGRVISLERLIDAMWGYDQPDTARSQIHASITAIRRALRGAGAVHLLETRGGGYVALPEPGQLDVEEFAELVAAGELREALALWQGEALADVHAHYVSGARALLDDKRLAAIERLAEAELAEGRHLELLDELAAQVAANPLRERLAGHLVLALHRSGRQADALAAARAYRTALAEEQGLDPGHAFTSLEQQVLADDPALLLNEAPPAPSRRSNFLPYDVPDFSGRSSELASLEELGGVVSIDGMAGIGKTALAVHVAHRLANRYPDGQLFIDLRAHTAGQDPIDSSAALEALLRQLGVPAERIPPTLAGRSAMWRAELADRRVLVVLDNAADSSHVLPLMPGVSDSLVLITSRRRLIGLDGAQALSVDVLSPQDAAALFTGVVGGRATAEPDAVRDVLEHCGYLPLAIRISAARLQHRPSWTVGYLADRLRDQRKILDGVAAAFTVSYEQLSDDEQRMFRLLGQAPGRDIEPHAAGAMAEIAPEEAEDLLEGLLDAHMLLQHEPGRYTFHDLLREHARSLAEDSAAQFHLLVHYLHRARSAVAQLYPGSLSHRADMPVPATPVIPIRDAREAIAWLDAERANVIAIAVHGPEVCISLLAVAVRRYLDRQAHHDDALTLHSIALRRSRMISDPAGEARGLTDLGWTYFRLGEYDKAEDHARQALALALGEEPMERARALNTLGNVAWRHRDDIQAERHFNEALDLTRIAGDTWGEADVLGNLGMVLDRMDRPADARRHLDVALALHRKVGNPAGEAMVLNQLGVALLHQGEPEQARARHRQAADLFRELGNHSDEAAALNGLAEADPEHATEHYTAALALADATSNRPEQARAHAGLARTLDDADHGERALALYEELGLPEAEDVRTFCTRPGRTVAYDH